MRTAIYAGSFDPMTNGHAWMIQQAAALFDELVVAIGVNPQKRCTFGIDQRKSMIEAEVSDIPSCRVETFENLYLVDYAKSIGASHIVRGIRHENDFTYERTMRHINEDLASEITTVFLMPPRAVAEISSSMVKGLIGPEGWENVTAKYVSPAVQSALLQHFKASNA